MNGTAAACQTMWSRYQPTAETPWDLRRVVHLYRRSAFAATWDELQHGFRDEAAAAALERVLAGQMQHRSPEDFQETAASLAEAAVASRRTDRLQASWVYRMLFTPDPLGEQLTLMWHNHFATSHLKVDDPGLMWRQNETFRRLSRAPFGELLRAILRDPALLIWLDAPANRKAAPNENLARELMELFTLGIGHYTEADVKEAARSLTGLSVENGRCVHKTQWHDPGPKTILGQTGAWTAEDLVNLLLEHPATADRLAWRICQHFLGDENVQRAEVESLAEGLRKRDLDIGWAVETVLRSARFFDERSIGARIVPPVDYVVGAVQCLEQTRAGLSTALLAGWIAELGQDLFDPPNVGGWPGGRSWLSARTMIGRTRFAHELAEGRLGRPPRPVDVRTLARSHGFDASPEQLADFLSNVLLGKSLEPERQKELLGDLDGETGQCDRLMLARVLASPPAQLG